MESIVEQFFEQYERLFNRALSGDVDIDEVTSLYASEFIAASPAGAMTGKNDEQLRQVVSQGYQRYRDMGTKRMGIRNVRTWPIDDQHCPTHVAWTATYAPNGRPEITIDFDVHYLVQILDNGPKVFGWVSGDEQALLKKHGVI